MTGPHQSIIRRFTSTGQGAAAWMAARSDDTSYRARTSSSSLSIRTNMVGTHWLSVTPWRSMRANACSGSYFSITMMVVPRPR